MSALIIGHKNPDTDSIIAALAAADLYTQRGLEVEAVAQGTPAPETAFVLERFGLKAPAVVTSVAGRDVYAVDYSDLGQAPSDFSDCNLKGIIDHHKLGDMTSSSPVECVIMPVGCTNTIIKRMYDYLGKKPSKELAGAMLCAILSDTVIFKSPTCTEADRAAAAELAEIAGVADIKALGMELFTAKSAVKGVAARDLILRDFKDFTMSGKKIGIGQLELVDLSLLEDRFAELLEDLGRMKAEGRHTAMLLVTDIMKEGSVLLMASDDPAKVASAWGKTLGEGNLWLEGVMSRKKQVVPNLEKVFKD
ncbi:manganese-dependent inorganic pyrophosphatase [Sutterella sp.]|uniref:manganese-dependent inorganic pyrophosphatase n=1 Tax=Sutterella sp. TaxID=1981025 RepID=UPI0026E02C87|nr:manganese-dependent inorganic pyrophosphatase [Sutterella sp.]MDO5532847.1 manganese-dependent inorganic pyrophosphatase [Sutterella sp.]